MDKTELRQAINDVERIRKASDRMAALCDDYALLQENLAFTTSALKAIATWASCSKDSESDLKLIHKRAMDTLKLIDR